MTEKRKRQKPVPNLEDLEETLTTGQVAELLKVSATTVSNWMNKGLLEGFRIPGTKTRRTTVGFVITFIHRYSLPLPRKMINDQILEELQRIKDKVAKVQ